MPNDKINIKTPLEESMHNAVEDLRNNPKHGILCLVFPELDQHTVEMLGEEIEEILEDKLNTLVFVDV